MENADYEESIATRYHGLLSPEQIRLVQLIKREHRAGLHLETGRDNWAGVPISGERLRELQIESGVLPPVS